MLVTESQPVSFLYCREETRIDELVKFVSLGQKLIEEAVRLNIPITGPIHWHYHNFTAFPGKSFFLEVCLPVATTPREYDGVFQIKRTDHFLSVCELHFGSWYDLPMTYQRLYSYIDGKKLKTSLHNREVYVNVDFENPEANVTLIQIGIERQ